MKLSLIIKGRSTDRSLLISMSKKKFAQVFWGIVGVALILNPCIGFTEPAEQITMCIDHYPPYHIFPEDRARPYGVNIAIVEAVTQKLGLELVFTPDTPFKRCLVYMKDGQVDIMGGLLHTPERAETMHLLEYTGKSKKIFVVKKGSQRDVTKYEDLEKLRIGTVLGFKYFSAFDNDKNLKKDTASTLEKSLLMLLAGRVDVVIASEAQYNSLSLENNTLLNQTQICSYAHDEYNPVHIGISKASKFGSGKYPDAFRSIVQQMYANGEIHRIREAFYEDYYAGSEE